MIKIPKKGLATVMIGVILVATLISVTSSTSAGLLLNLQSVVNVEWSGNETSQPAIPRGPIQPVDLIVSYQVTRGVFGKGVLLAYASKLAFIKLEIIDKSPWVQATLQSDTIALPISEEMHSAKTIISFQVAENAPAYGLGFIKLKASVSKMQLVQGFEKEFVLNFVPSYKPLIDKALPETNSKEIGPMDTAVFPIVIENLGNSRSIVYLEVLDVPKGWNAVITSQVTLEEAVGAKATAYLVVKPPKNFGYHNDEQTIRVSMTPVRADNTNERGTTVYETFLIQSRGFSTPGFEGIWFICAFLTIVALVKLRKKNKH